MVSYTFHISNKTSALSTSNKLLNVSKHNLRTYSNLEKNEYDKNNISVLIGSDSIYKDVQKIYHEEFDESVKKYNETKIKSRQINDYFKHVSDSNNDLAVECIIQIGDKNFWNEKSMEKKTMDVLFQNQIDKLQTLVPEFKIASAVVHYDEQSLHMHVVGVPVTEFEKGLKKRVSKRTVFNRESLKTLQQELRKNALEHFKEYEFLKEESLKEFEIGRNKDIPKKSLDEYYDLLNKTEELEVDNKILEYEKNELQEENRTLEIKKNQLRSEFKTTEKQLEQYVSVSKEMKDVLKNINDKASNKIEELQRLEDEISSKSAELNVLNDEIELQREELNNAVKSLNLKENELNDINIALTDKNANLSEMQANFDMLDAKVNKKSAELNVLNDEIELQREELNNAVKSLNLKENELNDINIALTDKNANLSEMQANFDMLDAEVKKKSAELKKYKDEIEKFTIYERNREKINMINSAFTEKIEMKTFFNSDKITVKKSELMSLLALSKAFDEKVKNIEEREKQLNLKENSINKQAENIVNDAKHQAKSIIQNAMKSLNLDETVKLAKYEKFVGDEELIKREREQKQQQRSRNVDINEHER